MMFGEEFKDKFDYDLNFVDFTIIRKVFRDFVKTVL